MDVPRGATAINIDDFAREPMRDKLVIKVPGVGPIAAQRLNGKRIMRADELYQKFKSFRFDEQRFRGWFLKICPGARVSVVHRAFMAWKDQHEPNSSEPSSSTGRSRRPAQHRQSRVSFDSPSSPPTLPPAPEANSTLHHFMALISSLLPNIAPDLQTEYMGKVLNITQDFEKITKNRRASAQMPPPPTPE